MSLSAEARALLPALAREVIQQAVLGQRPPDPKMFAKSRDLAWPTEAGQRRGVFVTLHRHGRLRGCIGVIEASLPLIDAVVQNALSAAFNDPRFEPLLADELPDTRIEVSVLSPLQAVDGVEAIEIPRHGVLLEKAGRRAVFLPQVAAEMGWNRDRTLTELARKAGLPADAWRDNTTFSVFEAEAIDEMP